MIELEASTATVTEAAAALHVEPSMIAKTMSFLQNDKAVLILTEGTARVDNRKYKDTFHTKAKMIPFDEVETSLVTLLEGYAHSELMRELKSILTKV